MGRKNKHRKYNRKSAGREPLPSILIVCEDTKSSVFYFKGWKRSKDRKRIRTVRIVITPGKHGHDPLNIVKYAKERKKEFDEIYCVIDVDRHTNLNDAIQEAQRRGNSNIKLIISNPCFELWYYLHFQYSTASFTCIQVNRKLTRLLTGGYSKADKDIYQKLQVKGDEKTAIKNAKTLKRFHKASKTNHKMTSMENPSTDVFFLIGRLKKLLELL